MSSASVSSTSPSFQVVSGLTKENVGKKVSIALAEKGTHFMDVERHGLSLSHPRLHIVAKGPFLSESSTNSTGKPWEFEFVRRFPDGSLRPVERVQPLR